MGKVETEVNLATKYDMAVSVPISKKPTTAK